MAEKITLLFNHFTQRLRRASINKFRNASENKVLRSCNETQAGQLLQAYFIEQIMETFEILPFPINIETFFKKACAGKKEEKLFSFSINSHFIKLTLLFINYISNKPLHDGLLNNPDLTSAILKNKDFLTSIDPHIIDKQLSVLGYAQEIPYYYYNCYYSIGNVQPEVALLKINQGWDKATLEFARPHSIHDGNIVHLGQGKNIFITITDRATHYMSLLSIIPDRDHDLPEIKRFDGYYCSALNTERGSPVAGKLIIKKEIEIKAIESFKSGNIPSEISVELLNERFKLKKHNVDPILLKKYVGVYEAYWFKEYNGEPYIMQMAFQIKDDGITVIRDKEGLINGYVHLLDEDHSVLKCSFQNKDQYNHRLTFTLGINSAKMFDGVYSGQRINWQEITAGKIRLYESQKSFDEIEAIEVSFTDADRKLPNRGKGLTKFFWGNEILGNHNNLIQPNLRLFENYVNYKKRKEPLKLEGESSGTEYSGYYLLYKLDSTKKRINLYNVEIREDGTFNYTIELRPPSMYLGRVKFVDDCLILTVELKDSKPHSATYIFYVSGKRKEEFDYLSGTYSAVASSEKSPICGRAIMVRKENNSKIHKPIAIGSLEYYHQNNSTLGIVNFLSIIENNMIKSKKSTDKIVRLIDYGDVFFVYACQKKELTEKIRYLFVALQNGFTDLFRLEEALMQDLISIRRYIEIFKDRNDPNIFQVTCNYKNDIWKFPYELPTEL